MNFAAEWHGSKASTWDQKPLRAASLGEQSFDVIPGDCCYSRLANAGSLTEFQNERLDN
jgi:hypothetical protein